MILFLLFIPAIVAILALDAEIAALEAKLREMKRRAALEGGAR